jgi:predicted O-linked N-acetylglucosamine transferase (SPINDLY family)
MGVPVVALAGDRHSGRVGLSLLTRVGLPDLIAQTPERYVAIATELARDPARLASLRASIRDRMAASPLRDEPGFARRFEAMLRDIWRQWCRLPQ